MNHMSFLLLFLGCSMILTPSFAATNKMKNEPTTIGGIQCGDTPFKQFSSDDYLGRHEYFGCPKVYTKQDKTYNFNKQGQLYQVHSFCNKNDIRAFTKKYGKPARDEKTGNEGYETRMAVWVGGNTEIRTTETTMNINNTISNTCSTYYYCNNIDRPRPGMCDPHDIQVQNGNTDIFTKNVGTDFAMKVPDKASKDYENFIEGINNKTQSLGLPKPESVKISKGSSALSELCLIFNSSDYTTVKNVMFREIGDISNLSLDFTGETSHIQVFNSYRLKNNKADQFSVCMSKAEQMGQVSIPSYQEEK